MPDRQTAQTVDVDATLRDLVAFLRACYAERRALAEGASPGPWHLNDEGDEVLAVDGILVTEAFALSGNQLRATATHIAANDPQDVLADLDAKDALLADLLAERHQVVQGDCWYTCTAATEEREGETNCDDDRRGDPCDCGLATRMTRRLRLLAKPFSDHPDYQGRWAE